MDFKVKIIIIHALLFVIQLVGSNHIALTSDLLLQWGFDINSTSIVLENRSIETIPSEEMISYINLTRFVIREDAVFANLKRGAFAQCFNLNEIYIYDCPRLTNLTAGCFNDLVSLQSIVVSGTSLTRLHASIFDRLYSLKHLDFSDNKIEFIDQMTFARIEDLQMLILRSNRLKTIQPKAFFNTPNLHYFDLQHNQIEWASIDSFVFLCSRHINFDSNPIEKRFRVIRSELCEKEDTYTIEVNN